MTETEIVSGQAVVTSYISHNQVVIRTIESYPDGKIETDYRLPNRDAVGLAFQIIGDAIRAFLSRIVIK